MFPEQIENMIAERVGTIDGIEAAVTRKLRSDDPNCVASIMDSQWVPEYWCIGDNSPHISRYDVHIMVFVKGLAEVEARRHMNVLQRRVRQLVATDDVLGNDYLVLLRQT